MFYLVGSLVSVWLGRVSFRFEVGALFILYLFLSEIPTETFTAAKMASGGSSNQVISILANQPSPPNNKSLLRETNG